MPAAFSRHVRRWLPGAEQVTLDVCGHVPQVERPEETHQLLLRFFAQAEQAAQPTGRAAAGATRVPAQKPLRRRASDPAMASTP